MHQDPPTRSQPICDLCHNDDYSVYEHVRAVKNPPKNAQSWWDVDCWRGKFETTYGFTRISPTRDPLGVQAFP